MDDDHDGIDWLNTMSNGAATAHPPLAVKSATWAGSNLPSNFAGDLEKAVAATSYPVAVSDINYNDSGIARRKGGASAVAAAAAEAELRGDPARNGQQELDMRPLSLYTNKGAVFVLRIWHSYILFTAAVTAFAIAVSLQLHSFFSYFNSDTLSMAQLALDVLLALTVTAFMAVYVTVIADLLSSAWSGAEYLHIRKVLFATPWAPRKLAIFWDCLVQFLRIVGFDILPLGMGFYFYLQEGFYGFLVGLFATGTLGALLFGAIVFVLEIINGLVELCLSIKDFFGPKDKKKKKEFGIYTLRARAERAGYQIQRAVATVATGPSLAYWFGYALLTKFTGSRTSLIVVLSLSILGLIMCGVATAFLNRSTVWAWIAEGTFALSIIIGWMFGRIWAGALRVLKLQMRSERLIAKPEEAPKEEVVPTAGTPQYKPPEKKEDDEYPQVPATAPLTEEFGADATRGTLSDPIGRWFARHVEPHFSPTVEDVTVFNPYASKLDLALAISSVLAMTGLMCWCSYLMSKVALFAIIANIYLAVPFLVLTLAFIIMMRPRKTTEGGDMEEQEEKKKVVMDLAEEEDGPTITDKAREIPNYKTFYTTFRRIEKALYMFIPTLLLIGLLVFVLANNTVNVGATIGFAILYFLIGVFVILVFKVLAKGFPTKAFLVSFGVLLFVFLLIFATASTYSGATQTNTTPLSSNSSGTTAMAATDDPHPYCLLRTSNASLGIVDLAFFANLAYAAPGSIVQTDLRNWFGNEWTVATNYTSDPLLWFYEFSNGETSVVAVRGTRTTVDWITNLDLWSQVAIFQVADFFIPILRIWPETWAARVIYYVSPGYFLKTPTHHFNPLIKHVEKLKAQGKDVVLTGHSLGAGLAGIVGTRTNTTTVTFSPPGLQYSHLKFEIESAKHLDSLITSVIVHNDWVSLVDKPTGSIAYLPCNDFTLTCHSIVRTAVLFQRACGDPNGRRYDPSKGAEAFYTAKTGR